MSEYEIAPKVGEWDPPLWVATYPDGSVVEVHGVDQAAAEAALAQREVDAATEVTVEANEVQIRQNILNGLVTLEGHIATISGATPTAAQQKAALLFCLRSVRYLAKLEVRALDSVD